MHWVRFEDLVTDPKATMKGVMSYLLTRENIDGTVCDKILDIVFKDKVPTAYEPRSGKMNASFEKYKPEQISGIYEECKEMIDFFGYKEIFINEKVENPRQNLIQLNK